MTPLNTGRKLKTATSSSGTGSGSGSGSGSSEGCSKPLGAEEQKRRRMASNRESARKSRQKKEDQIANLIKEAEYLKRNIDGNGRRINEICDMYQVINAENVALMNEKHRLAMRLESLEAIVEIANVVNGTCSPSSSSIEAAFSPPANEESVVKTWELPSPPCLPIMGIGPDTAAGSSSDAAQAAANVYHGVKKF